MIIKKFVGKTEADAIAQAKKELGEGVVTMNVREVKKKGLFARFRAKQVEVTVALEEENDKHVAKDSAQKESAGKEIVRLGETDAQSVKSEMNARNVDTESIEKRLDSLQALLESQMKKVEEEKAAALEAQETPAEVEDAEKYFENSEQDKFIRLLYNTMLDNEVDEKYVNQILEDIDKTKKANMPIDYILTNIYQKMILKFGKTEGITPAENGAKVVLFVGPTGVGKTTTIAKIASNYVMEEKKKVALLTTDTYRIAAAEQLRTYANILEVPFRVIYTDEELLNALHDFNDYDYVFVDTTGHSHQNNNQLERMKELLESLSGLVEYQAFLVVSATTKYHDLVKITDKYKAIVDFQLIFTKLDETECLGNLLNIRLSTGAGIAYTAYGQNVPNDIEIFHPQKVVKQLLGGKNQ